VERRVVPYEGEAGRVPGERDPGEGRGSIGETIVHMGSMQTQTTPRTTRCLLLLAGLIALGPIAGEAQSVVTFAPQGTPTNDFLFLTVPEAIGTLDLAVERQGDLSSGALVGYLVTGDTALAGYDYSTISGFVRFQPGESLKTVPLVIFSDDLEEETEYLEVTLRNPGPGTEIGAPSRIRVGILDAYQGVRLDPRSLEVIESSLDIQIRVLLREPVETTVTVDYATHDGTAKAGEDYAAIAGTLVFAPGEQEKVLSILLLNDGLRETEEWFRVMLENPTGELQLGEPIASVITLIDNDMGVHLSNWPWEVVENAGAVELTVFRGDDLGEPFTVDIEVEGIGAVAGEDFEDVSGSVSFGMGEQSKTILIPILNDGVSETTEQIEVRLVNPSESVSLGIPDRHIISILDNDMGLEFTVAEQWISEAADWVVLTVQRGEDSDLGAFTVDYTSFEGSATSGLDFDEASGTLVFGVGETMKSIEMRILNDGLAEPAEYFRVRLENAPEGVLLGAHTEATVWIIDNDTGISFTQPDYGFTESAGHASLTVQRGNDVFLGEFSVDYTTVEGSAVAGADFTSTSGTLIFAEGEQLKTIDVPILNDGLTEGWESFSLRLTNPTGGMLLGYPDTAQIMIEDNDPGVRFAEWSRWAAEGGGPVVLTILRGNDIMLDPFSVSYHSINGSASAGLDYEAVSGTVQFGQGDLARTISVPILNDGLREGEETFRVVLSDPIGGLALGEPQSVDVYVGDNDPGVHWASNWLQVDESAGVVRLTVNRGNDGDMPPITVEYIVSPGDASASLDFIAGAGSVQFEEGQMRGFVEVPILNDGLTEPIEYFEVRITGTSSPLGVTSESIARVEIVDNDPGASFGSWSWETNEGHGVLELTVVRGNDVDLGPMSLDYYFVPQSAQPDQDYVESVGTLIFAEGELEKTLGVTLLEDLDWEGTEEFLVVLTNHLGAGTLANFPQASVRILDDDPVTWQLIEALPNSWEHRDVTFGNGLWLIPGGGPQGAAMLITTDTYQWERLDNVPYLQKVVGGPGEFLGISYDGEVYRSTNSIDWESIAPFLPQGVWPERMLYGDNAYLVLDSSGRTWLSPDGRSWLAGTPPQAGHIRDLTYSAGTYVAVTDQGEVLTSGDGLKWDVDRILEVGELHVIVYADGEFVAVGRAPYEPDFWRWVVCTSSDAKVWDLQWVEGELWPASGAAGHGRVILASEYANLIWSLSRVEGEWQVEQVPQLPTFRVAFDGNRFVAVGWETVVVSEDGLEWTSQRLPGRTTHIAHEDGLFVVGVDTSSGWSSSHLIATSPDLRRWTTRLTGIGPVHELSSIKGRFVALTGGYMGWGGSADLEWVRSVDGTEWDATVLPSQGYVYRGTTHDDTFIAVGTRNDASSGDNIATVWTTTNAGETWKVIDLDVRGSLYAVVWTGDHFLATGDQAGLGEVHYSSSDGVAWTRAQAPAVYPIEVAGQLGSLWMGVHDGLFWLQRNSQPEAWSMLPGGLSVRDVEYAHGRLVAVGDGGAVWRSSPLIQLESPVKSRSPVGEIQWTMVVWGLPGATYELQASVDLQTWTPVGTAVATGERTELVLPIDGSEPLLYYRVGSVVEAP
jgi:hypothetical protein